MEMPKKLALVEALRAVAQDMGTTVAKVAIAWVSARGSDIVPLVGARRRDQVIETLGATMGDQYAAAQMADLDSEH
jgi:aryl-alcohol dehydrogenase-like predicted oxidoreductase